MDNTKKKIVSFMNMKGGVCKTTLCVNIANTLATNFKKNVLVIDMDPQFNATQYAFGVIFKDNYMGKYKEFKSQRKTIFQLYDDKSNEKTTENAEEKYSYSALFNTNLIDNSYLLKDYIVNVKKNFDMILGDIELIQLQITQKSGIEKRLFQYIDANKLRDKYDYILIDSPPTYSFFFISSYLASDTYIIPLKPDFVSSLGLALLERATTEIIKSHDKVIQSLGIVYTLIDPRNKIHEPIIQDIESNTDAKNIFKSYIKYLKSIPDGVRNNSFMLDISENGINKDIIRITEEFISRMEGKM